MKYMLLLFNEESSSPPDPSEMARWQAFGEGAAKVATQIAGAALQPSTTATVVSVRDGKRITMDGPFIETKEVVGGYWMIQVNSKEEAIEWARRCPAGDGDVIEVRQVFEMSDFPADVQRAADNPTVRAQVDRKKSS